MTGNIYANTCIIDSASRNLTVDLGQTVSGSFKDVGDTGEWKDFPCQYRTVLPRWRLPRPFSMAADSVHPTKFANIGSAKGLALELADRQDKILIAPQAAFNAAINPSDHTATFPLSARYYATSMPVTAGTFSSVIQVTFTYQ